MTEPEHKTHQSKSDWTLCTLKVLLENRLDAMEKASELAYKNMDLRVSHLNELRVDTLKDRSLFVDVSRYEAQHEALRTQVESLAKAQSKWLGMTVAISVITGVLGGTIGALAAHIIK